MIDSVSPPIVVPVILCGGAGTRLWPVSREAFPKPFLALPDGQTLLHKTLQRAEAIAKLASVPEIVIVANQDIYFLLKETCAQACQDKPQQKERPFRFILEPVACNTAPAIAAAAQWIQHAYGSQALMLILPADHLIEKKDALHICIKAAIQAAQTGSLVTFGITPTRADTGFGYIELGATPLAGHPLAYKAIQFIEKPSQTVATALLDNQATKRVVWNSGMFCFGVSDILNALRCYAPQSTTPACQAVDEALTLFEQQHTTIKPSTSNIVPQDISLPAHCYKHAQALSIDHAVMEHAPNVVVIPGELGWSDIGSWNAFSALIPANSQGNRVLQHQGTVILQDVENCTIQAGERLIGAVGLSNLIIIDTPDALLISDCTRTQDVKSIVHDLKNKAHPSYQLHRTVLRPWGSYTVLEESERFKLKRLMVKPGAFLSLQSHAHRSEHWVVVSGQAHVVKGEEQFTLQANQSTYIPAGYQHRLGNEGPDNLTVIEVQCGDYLGEDDIIRYEDQYGRLTKQSIPTFTSEN